MNREQKLEETLRRSVVTYKLDDRYHCGLCAGSWTRSELAEKRERHRKSCVLGKETDFNVAEEVVEIPF